MLRIDSESIIRVNFSVLEKRLLAALAEGKSEAFWKIWKLHEEYLKRICFRYFRNSHYDAEDALSQAMLKSYETLPRDVGRIYNLRAWLGRLTSNVCLDIHRQRQREQAGFDEESLQMESPLPLPEEFYTVRELSSCLVKIVESLPERLKSPLVMRTIHESSYREVALSLGIQEANARKRVQLAKEFLRRKLKEKGWL